MRKMLYASLLMLLVVGVSHAGHFHRARVVVAAPVVAGFYAAPVVAAPIYTQPIVAAYSAPCAVSAAVNVQSVTSPIIGAYSAPASVAVAAPAVAVAAPAVASYSYGGSLAVVGGGYSSYGSVAAVRVAPFVRERVVVAAVHHPVRAAVVVGGRGAVAVRSRPAAVRVDAPGVRVRVRTR